MAVKKALSKELSDLISKYLSKGGKVKKLPAGKAKGATDKTNIKPKNLPRDKQGKTLKFDADGEVKFKDGGTTKRKPETEEQMLERLAKRHPEIYKKLPKKSTSKPKPKPNPRNKKRSKEQIDKNIKELTGKTREEIDKDFDEMMKKLRRNQMDRSDPTGIDVKNGGLVLRVTRKGPLYKGKKSGSKKT
jgi:hypothetical protein